MGRLRGKGSGSQASEAATHRAVVAEEAQGRGWLQWKGQDLLEVQWGLHDGGLP